MRKIGEVAVVDPRVNDDGNRELLDEDREGALRESLMRRFGSPHRKSYLLEQGQNRRHAHTPEPVLDAELGPVTAVSCGGENEKK